MLPRPLLFVALFAAVLVAGLALAQVSQPESVGFSKEGLKAFQQEMRALVDEAKLAGVTTLVARHGKVVHFDAYGVQDLESKRPVTKDTIFRIASMTKPIVGVAMMMLWEEGQVDARRSGVEAHPRVRRPQGRDAEWRSAADQADDDAAVDEPYRGLRRQRRLRQDQTSTIARSRCRR